MCRILLIDDEKPVSEMLYMALKEFGHQVKIASGGSQGILMFNEDIFDVVVTDIRMSGTDGYGVARHIRGSKKSGVPVIAISGTAWIENHTLFDSVIPKPFDLQTLLDTISEMTPTHPRASLSRGCTQPMV